MGKIKRMELETRVQVWLGKERLPDYAVALTQKEGKEVCLEITADDTTCVRWTWYLSTLLRDKTRSDLLYLDWGQGMVCYGDGKSIQGSYSKIPNSRLIRFYYEE